VWFCDRDSSGILEDSSTAMYVNYDPNTEALSWSIFVFQTADDRRCGRYGACFWEQSLSGGLLSMHGWWFYSARVSHLARYQRSNGLDT
jgi:hypothetical protein